MREYLDMGCPTKNKPGANERADMDPAPTKTPLTSLTRRKVPDWYTFQ